MKIKKIEYSNFRNFKDRGSLEFSTDGKVNIIYGNNGSGKTTFHQLFQWIIYGKVQFNKTTTNKLYNLELEKNAALNEQFSVFGSIDFEHKGEEYNIRREAKYKKNMFDSILLKTEFSISKKSVSSDWNRLPNPEEFVEQILPSGLSEYFFFDGENMIADLKMKGKESASKLKRALYLILGLNIYDRANDVIGNKDLSSSVIGSLHISKTRNTTNVALENLGSKFQSAQERRDALKESYDKLISLINEKRELINELSEKIGGAKSQKEYNKMRNGHKENCERYKSLLTRYYHSFGDTVIESFPKFFLSATIDRASKVILTQSNMKKIISGVDVPLLDALLKEEKCICGNKITEKEIEEIKKLYKELPPYGYANLYNNFTNDAKNWGKEYSKEKVESHIADVTTMYSEISREEKAIIDIDKKMKEDKEFEHFVDERIMAEEDLKTYINESSSCSGELSKAVLLVESLSKQIDRESASLEANKIIELKIQIMNEVKNHFEKLLEEKSEVYSQKLEENIQFLLNLMLEAKREVKVTKDFLLRVYDSYGDESKSEGQFATVSFAYIGGIFKVLMEEELLSNQEYPLVLDAPFSKLGDEPRHKVIDIIPNYAPQIIIFTKDNLQEEFGNKIGKVYTIFSNEEQNVSEIREGYLWK